jgi:outer membrane murein-binding lipoprotein Lpp
MKKLFPIALLASMLLVAGCHDTKKVTQLQEQVDKLTLQVTDLTDQVAKLTAERDSLSKVITRLIARKSPVGS